MYKSVVRYSWRKELNAGAKACFRIEPRRTYERYELRWLGHPQKKHQLLCAPGGWHDSPGEHDHGEPSGARRVGAATATAMDGRHGGHAVLYLKAGDLVADGFRR